MLKNKNLILFGAGNQGKLAYARYGSSRVAYFCDNNENLIGKNIGGIEVISFGQMKELYGYGYIVMVTPIDNSFMIGQLEREGITEYLLFENKRKVLVKQEVKKETYWDKEIKKYVAKCSNVDTLTSTKEFKSLADEVIKLTKEHGIPYKSGRLWEGNHYGNLSALVNYAEIDDVLKEYSPLVSHIDCAPVFSAEFYNEAVIMSGEYYKKKIHHRFPYVPVFSVGPYIHYAKGIYSEIEYKEKKLEIGRMLLVFLPHSEEFVHRVYNKNEFIDKIVSRYSMDFDSIWMCAFWVDINDDICKYAEEKGIHVVTAGFRFDENFDRRLRTIIELSDVVLCGDIGTFIAYSLHLKKPVARIRIKDLKHLPELEFEGSELKKIQLNNDYTVFERDFEHVISDDFSLNNRQYEWMEPFAGFSKIRDKDYIKKIFYISKAILERCVNNHDDYPAAVRNTYYDLYDKDMIEEMYIMKTATGGFLD